MIMALTLMLIMDMVMVTIARCVLRALRSNRAKVRCAAKSTARSLKYQGVGL